jgi:hypothetical protein
LEVTVKSPKNPTADRKEREEAAWRRVRRGRRPEHELAFGVVLTMLSTRQLRQFSARWKREFGQNRWRWLRPVDMPAFNRAA